MFDVNQDKYVEQASRGRPEGSFRSIEDRNQIRLQTIKREQERGCIESDDAILRRCSCHFHKNLMWQSQATEDDATFDVAYSYLDANLISPDDFLSFRSLSVSRSSVQNFIEAYEFIVGSKHGLGWTRALVSFANAVVTKYSYGGIEPDHNDVYGLQGYYQGGPKKTFITLYAQFKINVGFPIDSHEVTFFTATGMCRSEYEGRHPPKGRSKRGKLMDKFLCMAADLETIASPEHYCDINNVVGSIGQLMSPFKATKDVKVRMAKKALRILIRFDKKTNGKYRHHLNKWICAKKHRMEEKLEGKHLIE